MILDAFLGDHPMAGPTGTSSADSQVAIRTRNAIGTRRSNDGLARRCRRKFLRFFPDGFCDETYRDWERDYKWETHRRWNAVLDRDTFQGLLSAGEYGEIAARAIRVEQQSRHSMIFSFEKMALRDAVRSADGARIFAVGLFNLLHGSGPLPQRFAQWVEAVSALPRRQTRVLTWPLVTVFGFIAQPKVHVFVKPLVTRRAAEAYGYTLEYTATPSWTMYARVLDFARRIRADLKDLRPRDMIDIQSFMWVQGSDEYAK